MDQPEVRPETREEALGDELLLATLQQLVLAVKAGACAQCGRTAATPQELSVAVRFLNDHGITIARSGKDRVLAALPQLPYAVVDPDATSRNLGRKRA